VSESRGQPSFARRASEGTPPLAMDRAQGVEMGAWVRPLVWATLGLMALRLVSLGLYPLMDTSEARYGEIARVMLETGNWVTPQEVPGVPFWAKPPLYAWLSAASMAALRVGEFALRLPSWLCAAGTLALVALWARSIGRELPRAQRDALGALAPALLAASALFFVSAGAVMTDPVLTLSVTAMLASFHFALVEGGARRAWRWLFFAAAGLGMLAKGPVVFVFAGLPILAWCLLRGAVGRTLRRLPWVGGLVLFCAIWLPWYLAAEARTPGFLRYFILGEHFGRFLQPGWKGDLYGTAHAEPLGTIWLYLAASLLALAPLAVALGVSALRRRRPPPAGDEGGLLLLSLSAFLPLLLFTFAGNIIWTYALPPLVPLAILMANAAVVRSVASRAWAACTAASVAIAIAILAIVILAVVPRHTDEHSASRLVERWRELQGPAPGTLWYWGRRTPASLRFYSRGTAQRTEDAAGALQDLARTGRAYVVLEPGRRVELRALLATVDGGRVQELDENRDLALVELLRP
jgi:4-amino-4-deoxy-L-arabinose transferase-like glycosyltransferase